MDGEDGGGGAEGPHVIEVDKPGGARGPRRRRVSLRRHFSGDAAGRLIAGGG
jgi:hypothetical protein